MNDLHPMALFRLTVLGPLISRDRLERGELKAEIRKIAAKNYNIPDSSKSRLSEKTIESWYYAWRRGGIDDLAPKLRSDRGQSKLPLTIQDEILKAKRANQKRSIDQLIQLVEKSG